MEITLERANELVKMFKYLQTRGYNLAYYDNSYRNWNGIDYIVYPSYQLITVLQNNKQLGQIKQENGVITYWEFNV